MCVHGREHCSPAICHPGGHPRGKGGLLGQYPCLTMPTPPSPACHTAGPADGMISKTGMRGRARGRDLTDSTLSASNPRACDVPDGVSPSGDSRSLVARRASMPQISVWARKPRITNEASQADSPRLQSGLQFTAVQRRPKRTGHRCWLQAELIGTTATQAANAVETKIIRAATAIADGYSNGRRSRVGRSAAMAAIKQRSLMVSESAHSYEAARQGLAVAVGGSYRFVGF